MSSHLKVLGFGAAVVALTILARPSKADDTGTLILNYDLGLNDGGPFTAVLLPGSTPTESSINSLYSGSALATTSNAYGIDGLPASLEGFETFCVETSVEFWPTNWNGDIYDYSTGLTIQQNGNAYGAGYGYLTQGAAYLYSQFATGNLTVDGFSYSSSDDLESLQFELWALEGEYYYTNPDPSMVTALNTLADAYGGINQATATSDYGVQVLELTYTAGEGGGVAQDQLIYTGAVPDGGANWLLLGMSVLGLAAYGRRKVAA